MLSDINGCIKRNFLFWLKIFITALFFGFIIISIYRPIDNTDFWFHLKTGEIVFNEQFVPIKDIYSHTVTGQRWIAQSWLYDVFIYVLFVIGSWTLVIWFKVLCGLVVYALLFKMLLDEKVSWFISLLLLLLMHTSTIFLWVDRPHILSFVLIILCFYWLKKFAERKYSFRKILAMFIPLFLFWGNVHSSVILGLGLIGLFWLGEVVKKGKIQEFTILGISSFLISLFNPNLWYEHLYVKEVNLGLQNVILHEWEPTYTYLNDPQIQLFMGIYVVISLFLLVYIFLLKQKLNIKTLILLSIISYFALVSLRHVGIYFILGLPLIAPLISKTQDLISTRFSLVNIKKFEFLSIGLVGFLGIISFLFLQQRTSLAQGGVNWNRLPIRMVDYLEENKDLLPSNIYNPYHWGGFLIWRLYPDFKVFIDSRWDPYAKGLYYEYQDVALAKIGFEKTLVKYEVDLILLQDAEDWAKWELLGARLEASKDWIIIYKDDLGTIFLRNIDRYQEIIQKDAISSALFYAGEKIYREGERDTAIQELKHFIETSPDYTSFAYNRLGVMAASDGDWDQSRKYYEKAIEIAPNYAAAYHNLGRLYELKDNDYETALSFYKTAIEKDPQFVLAYLRAGDIYYDKIGDSKNALKMFKQAEKHVQDPATRTKIERKIWAVETGIKIE